MNYTIQRPTFANQFYIVCILMFYINKYRYCIVTKYNLQNVSIMIKSMNALTDFQ